MCPKSHRQRQSWNLNMAEGINPNAQALTLPPPRKRLGPQARFAGEETRLWERENKGRDGGTRLLLKARRLPAQCQPATTQATLESWAPGTERGGREESWGEKSKSFFFRHLSADSKMACLKNEVTTKHKGRSGFFLLWQETGLQELCGTQHSFNKTLI